MPYPIGFRPYGNGAPAPVGRAWIVVWSLGDAPRPPTPSGKCTQARPRSYCAPRNSAAGVLLGSCSASSSSISALTRCSSVVTATGLPSSDLVELDRAVNFTGQASGTQEPWKPNGTRRGRG